MPAKSYKLPEKIANLPAGELEEICKNPGKYDLTIADLFQIGEYASKITSGPADSELKASNAYLKKENERLERNLDDYIERYDRVEQVLLEIRDIIEEYFDDDEEDD